MLFGRIDNGHPIYVEEQNIGMKLVPAGIDAQRGYFYLVSESALFIHDITSGKRLKYVEHGSPIVSTHIDDGLLITTTREGKKHAWSCSGESVEETCLGDLTQPLCWGYATDKELYFLSEAQAGSTNFPARTLYRLSENSADSAGSPSKRRKGAVERTLRAVLEIDFEVDSKRSLAISGSYAIACAGKELRLLPYNDVAENFEAPKSFLFTQRFPDVRDELVVFDSCHIHEDSVYAALTTGRIYIWNRVSQFGLDHTNKMFINATTGEIVFLVSSNKTIFVGSGDCQLAKWCLATSGAGRWHVGEYLGLEAPPEMLCLSQDETLLGVVLANNSACLVQTSRMTILRRTSVLSTPTVPALQWLGLCADPAQPNLVIMGAHIGCVQWMDPARWQTVALLDVSQENPPHRDSIDRPDYLWMNPYLIWPTATAVFVAEQRRDEDAQCFYLKFFRRESLGSITDLSMEECVVCPKKVVFIRTSLDEIAEPTQMESQGEEVLSIDQGGINTFVRDPSGRWQLDLARKHVGWQRSAFRSCSRIRGGKMGSVNTLNNSTYLLIWEIRNLEVEHIVDSIPDAKQVEWAPRSSPGVEDLLLVSFQGGIAAYNLGELCFSWVVALNEAAWIHATPSASFVYTQQWMHRLDCARGSLHRICKFDAAQAAIAVSGAEGNFIFSGLSEKGLSLLKLNIPANDMLTEPEGLKTKSTAFAEVLQQKTTEQKPQPAFIDLRREVSASKLLDGPSYTLAPITHIAPIFVRSCLRRRENQ